MGVRIITDTSCDLPDEKLEKYKIEMIPLKVSFDDGKTYLDRVEISPSLFVEKMVESEVLPKTSTPDPETFISCFSRGLKECGGVLFVSLSSGLSSTYQTALLAKQTLASKKICVFDTLTASLGTGIAAIKAAQMAAGGLNVETIFDRLVEMRKKREVFFTLDTLENVVKGGRLSKFHGFAGQILNIKPILRGDDRGVPVIVDKVRGRNRAIQRLINMMEEISGPDFSNRLIGVSHVRCPEDAEALAKQIEERYQPEEPIIISEMGATIGVYAGVGGLMVNY